jgi:hypothetical protein
VVLVGGLAGPVPAAFFAATVQSYAVPLVRPVTFAVSAVGTALTVLTVAPLAQLAMYPVIADPPSKPGTVHVNVIVALPAVAALIVGAVGTVLGVADFELDAGPQPAAFVARTAHA